jgi:RNA polymerase sigma-70 factor (ECF subfamily)
MGGKQAMDIELEDDRALARCVAAGEEEAVAVFYERYADALYAFIYHHLGRSRADAEDVWQETLLAALRSAGSYRGGSRLFTWLCSIACHKVADHLRRQGRAAADTFSDLPEAHLSRLVAEGPLPQEVVEHQATSVRVVQALGLLSEDYRAALVARYADGLGVGEVARLLGRSYKATESLLSRARAAMQGALARLEEEM